MRKYGVETVFNFAVYNPDGVDLDTDWVPAQADCELMKNEGASTMCTNTAADEGVTYSLTLTATEMQCAHGLIKVQDAATKVILDIVLTFDTYGDASAQHAVDFDDSVRAGLTALPNAVVDGANGLATSAGGATGIDDLATPTNITAGTIDTVTNGVTLAAGAVTDASLAGGLEIVFETDFGTNYNTVTNAWETNLTDTIGTLDTAQFTADFLTSALIADNALANEHFADGALTATEITSSAGAAVTSIGANVITASALATDAVDEIVDATWDEPLTTGTHNVADSSGKRVRNLHEGTAYEGGMVWIDTVNGTGGTDDYELGTASNPVSNLANAITIAGSVGLTSFHVAAGSTITFAEAHTDEVWIGESWILALGTQNIDGSSIHGAAISGVASSTTGTQLIIDCLIGSAGITIPDDTHLIRCGVGGTITFGEAGDFFIDNCHSAIAGTGSPTLDWNTPGTASNLSCRHHSGGWTVENMGAGAGTCTASFEGNGQITWAASCAATSNASIRACKRLKESIRHPLVMKCVENKTTVLCLEEYFLGRFAKSFNHIKNYRLTENQLQLEM